MAIEQIALIIPILRIVLGVAIAIVCDRHVAP